MKIEPMNYFMSAEYNIDGVNISTLDAIKNGSRTSTTRSYWINGLPNIGETIMFKDNNGGSVIVTVIKVIKISPRLLSKDFLSQWSESERWTIQYALDTGLFHKKNLFQVKFKLATQDI